MFYVGIKVVKRKLFPVRNQNGFKSGGLSVNIQTPEHICTKTENPEKRKTKSLANTNKE